MREYIESTGYYLSCMLLFNMIYGLSIIGDGAIFKSGNCELASIITFVVLCICVLLGIIFTVRILLVDDSENNYISTGKQFEVGTVNDLTGENYFANFSVIVLTGVALPANPNWCGFLIFLLIEITLGIVYVKKKMYYMNPVLALMDYSIYECTGRDPVTKENYDGTYIFLTRNLHIVSGEVIRYKNIDNHVIRLNKKK